MITSILSSSLFLRLIYCNSRLAFAITGIKVHKQVIKIFFIVQFLYKSIFLPPRPLFELSWDVSKTDALTAFSFAQSRKSLRLNYD